jgi:hypothetical protein
VKTFGSRRLIRAATVEPFLVGLLSGVISDMDVAERIKGTTRHNISDPYPHQMTSKITQNESASSLDDGLIPCFPKAAVKKNI